MALRSLSVLLLLILGTSSAQAQWEPLAVPLATNFTAVTAIEESGGDLYVGTTRGLFRSADDGVTWSAVAGGIPLQADVRTIAATSAGLVVATSSSGVYHSRDGLTWTSGSVGLGSDANRVSFLHEVRNGPLYAGAGSNVDASPGVYMSSDGGASWMASGAGIPGGGPSNTYRGAEALTSIGDAVLVGIVGNFGEVSGTFRSTDGGASWANVSPQLGASRALITVGSTVYSQFGLQIYTSTDRGDTWTPRSPRLPGFVKDLDGTPGELWATFSSDPPLRSTDGGATWAERGDGLPSGVRVQEILVGERYVFGGAGRNNLWRRSRSGSTAGESVPSFEALALTAAPNPARGPVTLTVRIGAPQALCVTVVDVLGREVARLHDGPLAAGSHGLTLDMSRHPAGVYVVRAVTEAGTVSRTLTVVR